LTGQDPGPVTHEPGPAYDAFAVADDRPWNEIALEAQTSLDPATGNLMRAILFPGPKLFVTVHHLAIDGVSWRILLSDITKACDQLANGQTVDLGPKSTSFHQWAHHLARHTFNDTWPDIHVRDLPRDHDGTNTYEFARSVITTLDQQDTDALLHKVPDVYRTQINDVLLSALAHVLTDWAGQAAITLEGHGREEVVKSVDLSRTVGWFTTQFPVELTVAGDWGETLKSVKEQLRAVPSRGMSYTGSQLTQVCFNYHGQWDEGSYLAPIGSDIGPDVDRGFLLDITGAVQNGELRLDWEYSSRIHDEHTVQRLADDVMTALREIIAHCGQSIGGRTPSDFPLVRLTQEQLDRIGPVEDIYPLTPLQAGMLFHSLADSNAYFNETRLRLTGVDEPDRLTRAWQATVDDNPVLRSSVLWDGVDEPVQIVHEHVTLPVHGEPVDLTVPPMMSLRIEPRPDGLDLIWTSHHLSLDGWSAAQVFTEVVERYAGVHTPVARRPFRDYLEWLGRQDEAEAERHWRSVLDGFEAPTPLPYSRTPHAHRAES
ncbi:condensation domain-containing protein, partial [Kibdelosporangium lantanae]